MDGDLDRAAAARARTLRGGLAVSGLTRHELWAACAAIGDSLSSADLDAALAADLDAALAGDAELTDYQYDVVAQAINDCLVDMDLDHLVPSSADTRETG